MRAHAFIIVTGSEITSGKIIDINTSFICNQLRSENFEILGTLVVPDDPLVLKREISHYLQQSDLEIIILTGGLGPTVDDLTVDVLADIFQQKAIVDPLTLQELRQKFKSSFTQQMERQTRILENSILLSNNAGCAPGFICKTNLNILIALPGVPSEMQKMFTTKLMPYLLRNYPEKIKIYREEFYLYRVLEARIENDFFQKESLKEYLSKITYGICASRGALNIRLSSQNSLALTHISKLMREQYSEHYCSMEARDVLEAYLREKNLTIATAESCTGGQLAKDLTDSPGASDFFLGSIIAYHKRIKRDLLDIEQVEKYGDVSKYTVEKMARNVQEKFDADIGVGITGMAGPDSSVKEIPTGKAYISFALSSRSRHKQKEKSIFTFEGNWFQERIAFRETIANLACYLLYFILKNDRMPKLL